jgi:RNA polymerase sigma-70 factor (ECF subfamily)
MTTQDGLEDETVRAERSVRDALEDETVRNGLLNHARPRAAGQDAEDVVQETQTRALQSYNSYKPDKASVPNWLHGILNNVLRDIARRRSRQQIQLRMEEEVADASDRARPSVQTVLDRLTIEELLPRLSENDREVVQWRFLAELSHEEIAARLGISSGAARVRLSRAICELREVAGVVPVEERP